MISLPDCVSSCWFYLEVITHLYEVGSIKLGLQLEEYEGTILQ